MNESRPMAVEKPELLSDAAILTEQTQRMFEKLDVLHCLMFGGNPIGNKDERSNPNLASNILEAKRNMSECFDVIDAIMEKTKGGD